MALAPDIVMSDNRLAGEEDGFDVVGALRVAFCSTLPAIITKGDTASALIRRMGKQHMRVKHKPFDLDVLRSRIADMAS